MCGWLRRLLGVLAITILIAGPLGAGSAQAALPEAIQQTLTEAASRSDEALLQAVSAAVSANPGLAQSIIEAATRINPDLRAEISAAASAAGGDVEIVGAAGPALGAGPVLAGLGLLGGGAAAAGGGGGGSNGSGDGGAPAASPDPVPDPAPDEDTDPIPEVDTIPPPNEGPAPQPDEGTDPPPDEGTNPPPDEGTDPPPGEGTDPPPDQGTDPPPEEGTDPPPGEGTDPPPDPEPDPLPTAADFETGEYNAQAGLGLVNASDAYARGLTGAGVVIALFDTGLDVSHPEFAGRVAAGGYDFIRNTGQITDPNGHGSHVGGIAAANRDGTGMHGVAYEALLLPLTILDENGAGSLSDGAVENAIDHAIANGARIFNNSWASSAGINQVSAGELNGIVGGMLNAYRRAGDAGMILGAARRARLIWKAARPPTLPA